MKSLIFKGYLGLSAGDIIAGSYYGIILTDCKSYWPVLASIALGVVFFTFKWAVKVFSVRFDVTFFHRSNSWNRYFKYNLFAKW